MQSFVLSGSGAKFELYLIDLKREKIIYKKASSPVFYALLEEIRIEVFKSLETLNTNKNNVPSTNRKDHTTITYRPKIENSNESQTPKKSVESVVKLAFLPSKFQRSAYSHYTTKQQYETAIRAIEKQEKVDVVYAYWKDPASSASKIWKDKGLFSTAEIDVAAVKQYCADMDADVALIMRSSEATRELESYLVDLKSEEIIYSVKSSFYSYNLFEDIELQVAKALSTIIDAEIKTQLSTGE